MKTIKFNDRDFQVWNELRNLDDNGDKAISPTVVGLNLGFDYASASSKVTRTLKKLVKEKVISRSKKGKYKIEDTNFNVELLKPNIDH